VFGHQQGYFEEEVSYFEEDEQEVIYVPRRKRAARAAVEPDFEFAFEDDDEVVPVRRPKPRKAELSFEEKRAIAALTGKPQPRRLVSKELPAVKDKPIKMARLEPKAATRVDVKPKAMAPKLAAPHKPVVAPAPAPAPAPVVKQAALPKPALPKIVPAPTQLPNAQIVKPKTTPKLVLEPEDLPQKQSSLKPLPEVQKSISCTQATGIVSGFGFSAVKPQMCVGKTYSFKATRDGTAFEVYISSASGELTEVKRL
jgi:hypothetical protein